VVAIVVASEKDERVSRVALLVIVLTCSTNDSSVSSTNVLVTSDASDRRILVDRTILAPSNVERRTRSSQTAAHRTARERR